MDRDNKDYIGQYRQDLEKNRKEAALMGANIPPVDLPMVTSDINEPEHFKEDMVNSFKAMRFRFKEMINRLEELYMDRYQKYCELYDYVQNEKRQIETLHHIKINASTFSQLLSSIKKAKMELSKLQDDKTAVQKDLEDARQIWSREEADFNRLIEQREQDEKTIIERMDSKRSELEDEYEERLRRLEKMLADKSRDFEKELDQRAHQLEQAYRVKERELLDKEVEYSGIKNDMAVLKGEINARLEAKERDVTDALVLKYGHIIEVNQKEYESELKLKNQRITILDQQLTDQENEIKELREKLAQSDLRAHKLALKVQHYAKEMAKGVPLQSSQKMNVKINEREVTLKKDDTFKRPEPQTQSQPQPKIVRPLKEIP